VEELVVPVEELEVVPVEVLEVLLVELVVLPPVDEPELVDVPELVVVVVPPVVPELVVVPPVVAAPPWPTVVEEEDAPPVPDEPSGSLPQQMSPSPTASKESDCKAATRMEVSRNDP
jgi:hypothetical protein